MPVISWPGSVGYVAICGMYFSRVSMAQVARFSTVSLLHLVNLNNREAWRGMVGILYTLDVDETKYNLRFAPASESIEAPQLRTISS